MNFIRQTLFCAPPWHSPAASPDTTLAIRYTFDSIRGLLQKPANKQPQ